MIHPGSAVWFAIRYPRSLGPDPVADLWRRYEQGDLTSWEAARLFRLAGQSARAQRARLEAGRRPHLNFPAWRVGRPRTVVRTIEYMDASRPD
jgi:hypothetical protein